MPSTRGGIGLAALSGLLCGVVAVVAHAAPRIPPASACEAILVVMPRDEWRLLIERNGGGRINFAALPHTVATHRGTFRFADLHSRLVRRVRTSCSGREAGTVAFITARSRGVVSTTWCLTDKNYGMGLFEQAWRHRVEPRNDFEREDYELLWGWWKRRPKTEASPQ